jgi:hypothetical protein
MVEEAVGLSEKWDELLTVEEVVAMLSAKGWVYERTRRRGKDRLLRSWVALRFESNAVRVFAAQRKSRDRNVPRLECRPPASTRANERKDSRMARTKRQMAVAFSDGRRWSIRWRETEIGQTAGGAFSVTRPWAPSRGSKRTTF